MPDDGNFLAELFTIIWLDGFTVLLLSLWYRRILAVTDPASSSRDRFVVYIAPGACLVLLAACFLAENGPEIADRGWRIAHGVNAGLFWLFLASFALPWLGLDPRDDVAERRNRAAGWAVAGAQVGLALAFGEAAARNLGVEPPPNVEMDVQIPLVAVFLGMLSILVWFVLWAILAWATGLVEAITVERDAGAACRLAALSAALGLLVGDAFGDLPPALEAGRLSPSFVALAILWLAAMLLEVVIRRRATGSPPERPQPGDILAAIAYLAAAGLGVGVGR